MRADWEDEIEELEQKHMACEQELERTRATIGTFSRDQRILKRTLREFIELYVDTQRRLLGALRLYAPRKEYIEILELLSNSERSSLKNMRTRTLSDLLGTLARAESAD